MEKKVGIIGLKKMSITDIISLNNKSADGQDAAERLKMHHYLESEKYSSTLRIEREGARAPQYGALKQTRHGLLRQPLKTGSFAAIGDVAVKQVYVVKNRRRIVLTGPDQRNKLGPEFLCMSWAHALFDATMAYVKDFITKHGRPPFDIPTMRFVRCAFAMDTHDGLDSYMLEEFISQPFVKFIHNGDGGRVSEHVPEEYIPQAEFLAFAQHHQYWMTRRLAFISDFQGNVSDFSNVRMSD